MQSRSSQFAQSSHRHQIIRGDDRCRPVLQLQKFSDGLLSTLQLEITFADYRLCMQRRSMLLHRSEEGLTPELRRLEMCRSADERNLAVAQLKQMFNRLMDPLFIIHTNIACMWSHLSDVQKHHGDSPGRQALDHREIHLRRQDHHPTNLQFQQTLHIRSIALRLVVGIKNNDVIAQFERSFLNGLNKVRKEWVGYVRNDQAESPAPAGGQIARVYVWCITCVFNRS